jgi:hypothetical protein
VLISIPVIAVVADDALRAETTYAVAGETMW